MIPILNMAADNQNIYRQPLSEFAQKYGVSKDKSSTNVQDTFQGYKSGHTPNSPPWAGESDRRRRWKLDISGHQRYMLGGFPLELVRALRAYIPTASADFASDWEKAELHNPIHPLFELSEWETVAGCLSNYPPPLVGNGHIGFLVAENPVVWNVLKPILQLSTQYLNNPHLWPWWDALLSNADSDNKKTEQSPHVSTDQNLFFRLRTPEEVHKQAVQVKELLVEMRGHWLFHMRSMYTSSTSGGPAPVNWMGVTVKYGGPGKGAICLSSELITALLTRDLTEPERVMLVTFCARTITHEVAHATALHHQKKCDPRKHDRPYIALREAYFQDESLNELGHSMEQNVFKSDHLPVMSNTQGLMLAMHTADFPYPGLHKATPENGICQYLPKDRDMEPHSGNISFVPIEWMRMLLNPEFWDHYISRFGGAALIQDAPQFERLMAWNGSTHTYGDTREEFRDVFVEPDFVPPLDMPHGDKIAINLANRRKNMQREARDRLGRVLEARGYTRDPDTGLLAPPSQEELSHEAPAEPQAPGVPQAQETEQTQVGAPAPLPHGKEAPAPAERAVTPAFAYRVPDDVPEPLTAPQVQAAIRIRGFIRYFRNRLGLHCIATCTEDALWFHLARLVDNDFHEVVSREDWDCFLRACHATSMMLSWDPETTLVHAMRNGWETEPPASPPLPCFTFRHEDFGSTVNLTNHINIVRLYIFYVARTDNKVKWVDKAGVERTCAKVTWYDEDQITYQFNVYQEVEGVSMMHFRCVCLTYFRSCWTTGPANCIQYNAPNYLRTMLYAVDEYAYAISETTDIGYVLPTDTIREMINLAFEGKDVPIEDYIQHPRHLLRDNPDWWKQAILELLPGYFSMVKNGDQIQVLFTLKVVHSQEELDTLMTEAQRVAVYEFTLKYWAEPTAKRKIWPVELRAIYNSLQDDESLKINQPIVFFSCYNLPSNYCSTTRERQIEFTPAPLPPPEPQNTEGQNAQGGAQVGGQQGNQGGTQGGPQAQGGPQIQGGAQLQGPSGIPMLTQPPNQGGWAQGGPQTEGGTQPQGPVFPQGLLFPQGPAGIPILTQLPAYPHGPSGIPILTQPPTQGGWAPGQQEQQQHGNAGQQGM